MKKALTRLILFLAAVGVAYGAANDIQISQRNPQDSAWVNRIFPSTSNSIIGTGTTGQPRVITVGSNLTQSGTTIDVTPGVFPSVATVNGYFADPSTNPSFSSPTWLGDLGLATSSTDNAIVRFNGASGQTQNSVVTIADTTGALEWVGVPAILSGGSSGATLTLGTGSSGGVLFSQPVFVGSTSTPRSSDPGFSLFRTLTGANNSHGFSDQTEFTKNAGTAYAPFDSRILVSGTANYDHFVSFQSSIDYSSSGLVTNLWGFYDAPIIKGPVTTRVGLEIKNPSKSGLGSMVKNIGILVEAQSGSTTMDAAAVFMSNVGIGKEPILSSRLDILGANTTAQLYDSGTSYSRWKIGNSGSTFTLGKESAAGGAMLGGSGPYSSVIYSDGAYSMHFGVNNAIVGTFTTAGDLLVGSTSAGKYIVSFGQQLVRGAPSDATKLRWDLELSGSESGGNAGSDYTLYAYNDTGGALGQYFAVTRSSGLVRIANSLTMGGVLTAGSGSTQVTDSTGKVLSAALNTVQPSAGGTGQTSYTNGQLLIGNTTGNTLTKATLTAGAGVTVTNGTGSITLSQTGMSALRTGTATLVGGTVTVSDASTAATTRIRLSMVTPGGTVGAQYVSAKVNSTSFTITSTSASDTSVIYYEAFEP